ADENRPQEPSDGPAQTAGDERPEDAAQAVDDAMPSEGSAPVISVTTIAKGMILPNHTLLLEDSAVRDDLAVDRERMTAIGDSMSHLMTRLAFTDGLAPSRRKLLHYFRARYGDDAKVPLIRLYEDYFRDCKVPEAAARKAGTHEPVDYPGSMELRLEAARNEKAVKMWSAALAARLERQLTQDRVYVEREDLDAVHGLGPPVLDSRLPQATAAFLQLADDSIDGRIAVLNSMGPGYGKTFNRFFHLFPPELTDAQRRENLRSAGASRLAEVHDASFNNANLHPPLLDCEISSPGAHTSLSPEQQMPASSLVVSLNGEGELQLTHVRTAERVEILDLGLQATMTRSQMFQLLFSGFGRSKHSGWNPVVSAANLAWNLRYPQVTGAEVTVQPRVVYDRRIVLRRRSWSIQADRLPVRQRSESDAAFFARIDGWRERNGIPLYVYAFVAPEPDSRSTKRARDDYKPQFLSFHSAFSVSLFEAQIRQIKHQLRLEEMLPLPDAMMQRHGKRHAAEYVMQWTRRES
ncbi:MAG TPA: lantibiotic dehydratase, partial [Thermoanaerobaculia bacterium]